MYQRLAPSYIQTGNIKHRHLSFDFVLYNNVPSTIIWYNISYIAPEIFTINLISQLLTNL